MPPYDVGVVLIAAIDVQELCLCLPPIGDRQDFYNARNSYTAQEIFLQETLSIGQTDRGFGA